VDPTANHTCGLELLWGSCSGLGLLGWGWCCRGWVRGRRLSACGCSRMERACAGLPGWQLSGIRGVTAGLHLRGCQECAI